VRFSPPCQLGGRAQARPLPACSLSRTVFFFSSSTPPLEEVAGSICPVFCLSRIILSGGTGSAVAVFLFAIVLSPSPTRLSPWKAPSHILPFFHSPVCRRTAPLQVGHSEGNLQCSHEDRPSAILVVLARSFRSRTLLLSYTIHFPLVARFLLNPKLDSCHPCAPLASRSLAAAFAAQSIPERKADYNAGFEHSCKPRVFSGIAGWPLPIVPAVKGFLTG